MLGQVQLRKEIAIRLKQARNREGFTTAEEFCHSTNLPLDAYLRHEDGSSALRASEAVQYCKLLRIPLHWLMFGETDLKPKIRYKRRDHRSIKKNVTIKKKPVK